MRQRVFATRGIDRYVFAAVALLGQAAQSVAVAQQVAADTANPGIVAERPADGRYVATDRGYLVPYVESIPGTKVTFEMVPIAAGEFLMGSPASEAARVIDEGPQIRVRVAACWIGKHEVTWAEYREYMALYDVFKTLQRLAAAPADATQNDTRRDQRLVQTHAWTGKLEDAWGVDAVTSATPLYDSTFTYTAGEDPDQPAVTMTQFAARQYTKWLSGITGREFRLPTEAEWEYAARAGSTTAFSFGDSADELKRYAWYDENAAFQTHTVGTRQANGWGLHDTHGNVAEWTLDQFRADTYALLGNGPVDAAAAVRWPTRVWPLVIRGGSWLDPAENCRSAARQKSEEEEWKLADPNIPLSPWWFTEEAAMGVGMRIVRPLEAMTKEDKQRVWGPEVESLRQDVEDRLLEGRGALGIADPSLPAAAEAAERLDQEQ